MCAQAVEWLGELLDALLKTHVRLGDDTQETKAMLDKHRKFVDVAQVRHFRLMSKYNITSTSSSHLQVTLNSFTIRASNYNF